MSNPFGQPGAAEMAAVHMPLDGAILPIGYAQQPIAELPTTPITEPEARGPYWHKDLRGEAPVAVTAADPEQTAQNQAALLSARRKETAKAAASLTLEITTGTLKGLGKAWSKVNESLPWWGQILYTLGSVAVFRHYTGI